MTARQTAHQRERQGLLDIVQLDHSHVAALRTGRFDPAYASASAVGRILDAAIAVARLGTSRRYEHRTDVLVQGVPLRVPLHDLRKAVGRGEAPVPWLLSPDAGEDFEPYSGQEARRRRTLLVGGVDIEAEELLPEHAGKARVYLARSEGVWNTAGYGRAVHTGKAWGDLAADLDAIDTGSLYVSTLRVERCKGLVATASAEVSGHGTWVKPPGPQQKDETWSRSGFNEAEIALPRDVGDYGDGKSDFDGKSLSLLLRGAAASAGKRGEVTAHVGDHRPLVLSWKCDGIPVQAILCHRAEC